MKLAALVVVPFVLFIAASLVNQSVTGEDLVTGEKKGLTAKEVGEKEFTRIANNEEIRTSKDFDSHKCSGTALCISEKVTQIVDGDTIHTTNHKIRLSLVDTPEKGEDGYAKAAMYTARMCPEGSWITIDQDDKQPTDVYGRMLANVYCDGKSLNSALLYGQQAELSTRYCEFSEFADTRWGKTFGCKDVLQDIQS